MTILRVGSTDKYAENWSSAFGEKKSKPSTKKNAAAKTTVKAKAAKKSAKKKAAKK
ncbi:MAG: hypothetical protein R3C03_19955 [Pirellulaceae bacterium]